ncbi:hypothetical protein AB1Y20_007206 [Prymnesium parvum]|uniref:Uncharacterized protein n=1 Tax=Prymnesium parvum TaxID=97485 RepID=A0AB34IUL9_PRYPA
MLRRALFSPLAPNLAATPVPRLPLARSTPAHPLLRVATPPLLPRARYASGGGDSYDLRPCGASCPTPFECEGNPTDITSQLAGGKATVGYSRRYADNWANIFGKSEPSGLPEGKGGEGARAEGAGAAGGERQ